MARRRGRAPHDLARRARRRAGRHGVRVRVPPDAHPGRADSHWGYVSNLFVRFEARNRGVGSALLAAVVAAADARGCARLVLSPSAPVMALYRRAGFIVAEDADRLLIRPGRPA